MDEMSINEAIAALMAEMPKEVQDFLSGPKRNATVLALSQKYGLHADQAGELERALIFMLLGISAPADFVSNLQQAGIAPGVIEGLTKDVNEQVFMPLRKAEEAAPATRQEPSRPATPQTPPLRVQMSAPPPPPLPRPPAPAPMPVQSAPAPVIYQSTPIPAAPTREAPMPAQPAPMPQAPQATPPRPTPIPIQTNVPPQHSMQQPPPAMPRPPMPQPQQPSQNREALHDVLKSYGVDPYREPPE